MAVHDDAIFDLTPSDVTVTGSTSTMTTEGYVFDEATIETYEPLNTGHMYTTDGGWAFQAGSDTGATYNANDVNPPNFYTGYGNVFFTVHLGEGHAADSTSPPTNFLAGVELGTFDVDDSGMYYLDLPIVEDSSTTAPSTALLAVWKDDTLSVLQEDTIQYSSSDFPGDYSYYLYHLTPASGATKVQLFIMAVPQPGVPIVAGAGFGIVKANLFKQMVGNFYDDPQNVGYHGSYAPLTHGRHIETVHGREVIVGQNEHLTFDPAPEYTDITIVAAWVTTNGSMLNWAASWGVYPNISGYNGVIVPTFGGDPVAVAMVDNVTAVAMTFNAALMSNYYDLLSEEGEPIFGEDWGVGSEPPYITGEAFIQPAEGLLRMSVWDRVLTDAEIGEAIQAVSGIVPRDIAWTAPIADGGSPTTGFVVSVLKGGDVTEYPISDPSTVTFTVPAGATAVQVVAVNAVGRSAPVELAF